ncbi:MAG: hypothetical protein V1889_03040 [archaeon]
MKFIILIILLFLFIPLVFAETTFFDNPDDAFVMGNSPATGGVIITEEQQAGGGGCLYKWNCTDWSECFSSGEQTRDCVNVGSCPDTYKVPETRQNCTYVVSGIGEDLEKEGEEEGIVNENRIFIYVVVVLIILFVVFYLEKDYFKKLIKKSF